MATITTEAERLGASAEANSAAVAAAASEAPRPESILAEIPVVMHASHRSAGNEEGGKAQTVREESSTVMVFPQGCVLSLSSKLSRGDLVVLSNQQNRADMLCRVVNVREQPGGESYIELEFTQRRAGFWSDVPAASPAPVSPRPESAGIPAAVPAPGAQPVAAVRIEAAPTAAGPAETSGQNVLSASIPVAADSKFEVASEARARLAPAPWEVVRSQAAEREESQSAKAPQGTLNLSKISLRALLSAVGVCLFLAALIDEAYLLGRRGQTNPSNSAAEGTATPATYPVQPASTLASQALAYAEAHASAPDSVTVASPARSKDEPAATPAGRESEEAQPRRNAIGAGKLAVPIARRPLAGGLNEPPPVLPAQGMTLAEGLLGAEPLAAAPGSPGPAVPAANPAAGIPGESRGPKIISFVPPVYPSVARMQGLDGVVMVDATIDESGKVSEANAVSGPMALRQAAVDAVRKWKYQPAETNGRPVSTHQTIDVNFTHQ